MLMEWEDEKNYYFVLEFLCFSNYCCNNTNVTTGLCYRRLSSGCILCIIFQDCLRYVQGPKHGEDPKTEERLFITFCYVG